MKISGGISLTGVKFSPTVPVGFTGFTTFTDSNATSPVQIARISVLNNVIQPTLTYFTSDINGSLGVSYTFMVDDNEGVAALMSSDSYPHGVFNVSGTSVTKITDITSRDASNTNRYAAAPMGVVGGYAMFYRRSAAVTEEALSVIDLNTNTLMPKFPNMPTVNKVSMCAINSNQTAFAYVTDYGFPNASSYALKIYSWTGSTWSEYSYTNLPNMRFGAYNIAFAESDPTIGAFSIYGKSLYKITLNGTTASIGSPIGYTELGDYLDGNTLMISPSGKYAIAVTTSKIYVVFDLETGTKVTSLPSSLTTHASTKWYNDECIIYHANVTSERLSFDGTSLVSEQLITSTF